MPFDVSPVEDGRRSSGTSTVLRQKLSIPRLSPTLVDRTHILARLEKSIDLPLTIVMAPPGYGKTTTVAHWATSTQHGLSWISLGEEDNNPVRFLDLLVTAMSEIDPAFSARVLAGPDTLHDLHDALDMVLDTLTLATRHVFFVLDDFHLIVNEDILQAIQYFVHRLPRQGHLVIVSRSLPRIPLARLRASEALCEIDMVDLEFSSLEAQEYRTISRITEVDDGQWTSVSSRLDGWIAGLQLARLLLKGKSSEDVERFLTHFDGGVREIDDYLWEEVIDNLPEYLRSFMLRSSVLPYLEPEFCNFVLNLTSSSLQIRELRERGLFVMSLADGRPWIRYHRLLADALLRRFRTEAAASDIQEIHARSAAWLADHGQAEQGLMHAIESHQWDLTVELAHRICDPLALSDQLASMRYWLDLLPEEVVRGDPRLHKLSGWARVTEGNFSHRQGAGESNTADPADETQLSLMRMQDCYGRGDVEGMLANAQRAWDLVPDEVVAARLYSLLVLAAAQYLSGDFVSADRSFAEFAKLAQDSDDEWRLNTGDIRYADSLCLRGRLDDAMELLAHLRAGTSRVLRAGDAQIFWFLANIHLERNELDLADAALTEADQVAALTRADRWGPVIHLTRSMVAWARDDAERAFRSVEEAISRAEQLAIHNFIVRAQAFRASMWVAKGQIILADRWAAADLSLTWAREFNQPYPALTVVRLTAAKGDLEGALGVLDQIIAATTGRRRTGDLVRLHAMRAGLLQKLERTTEAAQALALAVDLGAPGGFLRSFLDEGDAIAGLFNHPLLRDHTHRHYALMVKRSFETQSAVPPPSPSRMVESLSARELDVLREVANGRSNRDIAQHLFISEPTVKKHMSNIYGKLNVLNRMQAVSLARELGLM